MPHFVRTLLLCAALPLSAAAAAQGAPPEDDGSEIVVEGSRDRERQIGKFIGALTDAPIQGQISRFDWEACPAAVGLSEAQNEAVVKRMRAVAKAAAVPLAAENCKPNVLVIVAPDKKLMIEQLYKQHPKYFEGVNERDVKKLAASEGPAAAWHVKGMLSSDGIALPKDILTGNYVREATDTPSRLSAQTRPHFIASVVVAEAKALRGLSITQFADYAAMRGFAQTDPKRVEKTSAPTILTVLDAGMDAMVPLTLTQWDMSFLTALYAAAPNHYAGRQRSDMKDLFKKDLKEAAEKE